MEGLNTRHKDGASERRRQILEIAAQLFARKGYRGTSIRDIGDKAGVLGGSLYHHIKSKDALFIELHNEALNSASERIVSAMAEQSDPWEKLRVACRTMLEIQCDSNSLTLPMMNDFREVPDKVQTALIECRDNFEAPFTALIEGLPLPEEMDRSIYRNLLLGLLNSVADWYRPGRLSPQEIGDQIYRVFRHSCSSSSESDTSKSDWPVPETDRR
ncbi:MAG: TetR/AcrR family transcriptional regulator [Sphingobium sp.]